MSNLSLVLALYLFSFVLCQTNEPRVSPSKVLIVYNANYQGDEDYDGVQDSFQVAQYYMAKRGVPASNIIGIQDTFGDNITLVKSQVFEPLMSKIDTLGNIDIILMSYFTPYGTNGISLDSVIAGMRYYDTQSSFYQLTNPYLEVAPGFDADNGRFNHTYKFYSTDMYLVTRIDGPGGLRAMMNMIDGTRYGDRYVSTAPNHYMGITYVDNTGSGTGGLLTEEAVANSTNARYGFYYGYAETDVNIAMTAYYCKTRGLPYKWQRSGGIIGSVGNTFEDGSSAETAPNALFYGGWYAYNTYLYNVWGWMAGSVAIDLDSSNFAYYLRQTLYPGWGQRALADGATCVSGVVGEPYTTGHPRPNILLYYLYQGYSYAEAASLSTPLFGWMGIHLCDPLYAPFATKTVVQDTTAPVLELHSINQTINRLGTVLRLRFSDIPFIEVAKVTVDWGTTTAYGNTIVVKQYWRSHEIGFRPLMGSTLYHYKVTAEDPVGNILVTTDRTFTSLPQTGYPNGPHEVPGAFNFRDFDDGGEGLAYHDVEPSNYVSYQPRADTGVEVAYYDPYFVCFIYPTEWLKYTINVTTTGTYDIYMNVNDGDRGTFHLEIDGQDKSGIISVPAFGGWGIITIPGVSISSGIHIFSWVADNGGPNGGICGGLDYVSFNLTSSGTDTVPPSVAITYPADQQSISEVINVQANATDNYGVQRVVFSLDGATTFATVYNGPFTAAFNSRTTSNGLHTISATAYDAATLNSVSTIQIYVNNSVIITTGGFCTNNTNCPNNSHCVSFSCVCNDGYSVENGNCVSAESLAALIGCSFTLVLMMLLF